MIRLYFIVITYVLIIIPHTVNTFFLQDVANITVPRNLTCKLNTNESALGSFQLCAIRIYRHINESSTSSVVLHNGLRYMNTFRRLIQNNCSNNVNMSQAGTGVWTCGVRFPFESYTDLQICVCASNNCNENLNTCQESAMNSTNMSSSIDFIPNLTSIIQCNDTLNVSNTYVKAGETGLGKAATAGIACGIIFSALIFTVEIIYFKFIYSGGANSGPSRSAAYRT
ncbi:unnamed protein product [Rotaria sp. Silwood1]|nr:unnamed protein product [Rotaria sp. Silwood1]CAF1659195.1 unnamed protein product [Rotaria sp. Silwood1]CAF4942085.1 unnamed protein product [Rotaria sp. Silwood1]